MRQPQPWVTITVKEPLPVEPTLPDGATWPANHTHYFLATEQARAETIAAALNAQGFTAVVGYEVR